MPDAYTYIAKPSAGNYTNINTQGREQYDQPNLTFDDASTFYDGVNQNAYTNVAKPTGEGELLVVGGMATGLLMPLTTPSSVMTTLSSYTKVPKPTT